MRENRSRMVSARLRLFVIFAAGDLALSPYQNHVSLL